MGLVTVVCLVLILGLLNPHEKDAVNLVLGFLVVVLGLLPTWFWARSLLKDPVPVLALHGLFYSLCFGLAGFVVPRTHLQHFTVSEGEYTTPLLLTALALLALYAGYWSGLRVRWPEAPRFLDRDEAGLTTLSFTLLPISMVASTASDLAGLSHLSSALWAVRTFAFVWVVRLTFGRNLRPSQRRVFIFLLLPAYVILYSQFVQGYLAGLLVFSQLIGITYVAIRKRIPLIPLLLAAIAFFGLNPAKKEYRDRTWNPNVTISVGDKIALFAGLAYEQLFLNSRFDPVESLGDSYTRVNHLHVTAAVVADAREFWLGESYWPLATKWIPRALWPDKPREDLGNRWAHEFGYLDRRDFVTSFNLPWLPEMYLNFGYPGMIVGSFVVGFLMAGVWSVFVRHARTPMGFAVGLVLCSSFFFPESNFSMDVGNLVIRGVTLVALGFGLTIYRPMAAARRPGRALAA